MQTHEECPSLSTSFLLLTVTQRFPHRCFKVAAALAKAVLYLLLCNSRKTFLCPCFFSVSFATVCYFLCLENVLISETLLFPDFPLTSLAIPSLVVSVFFLYTPSLMLVCFRVLSYVLALEDLTWAPKSVSPAHTFFFQQPKQKPEDHL